jgi:flagellar biosynthesis protein FlhB
VGRWKLALAATLIVLLCTAYAAVSTWAVLAAMRRNLEVIRENPLSIEAVATTLSAVAAIIMWSLVLLLPVLVICLLLALLEDSRGENLHPAWRA